LGCFPVAWSGLRLAAAESPLGDGKVYAAEEKGRVILLGFDGVEPTIVEEMMAKGELPNLAKLREQGGFQPLGSSNPPQSPTAWSSFATCKQPGNHGVYDFLRRNPANYMPGVGFGVAKQAELAPDGALAKAAKFENYRKGETFWAEADKQGARCKVLVVPFAYPVDEMHGGCMLCGLDVRDIRGTQSWYFSLSEALQAPEDVAGGTRLPLRFEGNTAKVNIPGIRHPRTKAFVEVPLTVEADRSARKVTVEIQGQRVTLAENMWSNWFEWTFALSPQFSVRAISRIHVLEAGELVRLYMTCLQYHPRAPYIPISSPDGYAGELADRYGLYKTIGWSYDTKALQSDDITEDVFLSDVKQTMAWHERLMLDELDRDQFDLLIAGWTATDRVAHMFWRFRDPKHPLYTEEGAKKYGRVVEDTYIKMDEIVGKAMAKLNKNDLLMVFSDHGFHSFRCEFSANTWLVRNGYLAVKSQNAPATAFTDKKYLQDFDWPRTKAYALGLGSIFLNLKGREGSGTVSPEETPALIAEIRGKLLEVTDPKTGDKVFREVYTRDIYKGESADSAPDIQLGFAEGYQMNKACAAGAAPTEVFSPNMDKWSGEHAASDVAFTPGILFANKSLAPNAAIIDLGPTALKHLGLNVPGDYEGRCLE
jgi:predicted AlkP superfamily phosphohydrolase/phosphomutase